MSVPLSSVPLSFFGSETLGTASANLKHGVGSQGLGALANCPWDWLLRELSFETNFHIFPQIAEAQVLPSKYAAVTLMVYLSQQLGSTWINIQLPPRAHRNRGSEASSRGRRSSMGSNSSKPSAGSEPFHGVVACWDAKQGIPCGLTKKFGIFGINVLYSINWGSSLSIVGIPMNKPVL